MTTAIPDVTDQDTPPTTPGPDGRARARHSRRARREPSLLGRYLGYVGYFVGAGLLSGAIVHHPLDPARYNLIAAAGAALFLTAALATELQQGRPTAARLTTVLGTSLALSFGIGMLSGGMQHFEDFPDRAAALIPAGLLLSFLAYTLKEARKPLRRILGPLGLTVLLVAAGGYMGLRQVAAGMPVPAGGHHHGTTEDGHQEEEEAAHDHEDTGSAPTPPATGRQTAPAPGPSTTPGNPAAPATTRATPTVPPHGSPGHHH
ncbi:hypothetical protein KNE206_73870 [Kitasatospora sp. NE20-6]|uniref:hypothetical protein n=1 Tax=Kitasatospora sp. NE20-6 TaxID=2859066 RepID=UPI0034DC1C4B